MSGSIKLPPMTGRVPERGSTNRRLKGRSPLPVASFPELQPSARILLGPGPSNIHPRVMKALLSPVVGHLDPDFVKIMEEIKGLLRETFQTTNEITFPVSGTGSAGMETALANLIEDGDEVIVGVNGVFGDR